MEGAVAFSGWPAALSRAIHLLSGVWGVPKTPLCEWDSVPWLVLSDGLAWYPQTYVLLTSRFSCINRIALPGKVSLQHHSLNRFGRWHGEEEQRNKATEWFAWSQGRSLQQSWGFCVRCLMCSGSHTARGINLLIMNNQQCVLPQTTWITVFACVLVSWWELFLEIKKKLYLLFTVFEN